MKTEEMLKKSLEVLKTEKVGIWYGKNLHGNKQSDTIESLEKGIENEELTVKEALFMAWLVGFQWHEQFSFSQGK